MAYESTEVTVSKSQEQVRTILRRAGADRIAFAEQMTGPNPAAGVEFLHLGLLVRMLAPLRPPDPETVEAKAGRSRSKSVAQVHDDLVEQEGRRIWRVLHWSIKTRMESIAEGLETFEQAFLPHLVDPATGRTIWDAVRTPIEDGALKYDGGFGLGPALELEAGGSS